MRITRALIAGLSLLWLASSIEGSGTAYYALLLGSFAAGIIMGAYGTLAPGVAAIIASIVISIVVRGSIASAPLLAAIGSMIISGLRVPKGIEALSMIPATAIALALAYSSISAPEHLASYASYLPGDIGLFLAAFLSSKTGVIVTSISVFLIMSYLAGSLLRSLAEVSISLSSPEKMAAAESAMLAREVTRGKAAPGYLYWLASTLIVTLLSPLLVEIGLIGLIVGAISTLYFRLFIEAIIEWRPLRMALLTWPFAALLLLLSSSPEGIILDALGVPGPVYRDPLAPLIDPLWEARVEEALKQGVNLIVVVVRLFWGG